MTITISEQAFEDLFQETVKHSQHPDTVDRLDVVYEYPELLGKGYLRDIKLREGLYINILDAQIRDRLMIIDSERFEGLSFHFHIFGRHEDKLTIVRDRQFALYGSGLASKETNDGLAQQQALEIEINLDPRTLRSFIGDQHGQLPSALEHLIRSSAQERYTRVAALNPAIENALWQIIHCPYHSLTKRMFLEGKVLELVSLVLEQEMSIWNEKHNFKLLKAGTLERIYYARTLLLRNLHHPPSLNELAQQVKLNECTLKQGFRQEFDTTVFGYLHNYRLEQAQQLLTMGNMKVSEVAQAVGFANRSYFAIAFKKRFGVNPKAYQQYIKYF
jgi:AraC-like DNA-binding protein